MFDWHDINPIISSNVKIGVYWQPITISPSYEGFFNEVWNPKLLNEQRKELDSYLNITWFLAAHNSGIKWDVEGGTNFWSNNQYWSILSLKGG